jgi:hypothetical protein
MANDKAVTHGDFNDVAKLTMELKDTVQVSGADVLDPASREALDQILSRVARIVFGDQAHRKHWEDIQGFCQMKLDSLPAPTLEIEHGIRDLIRKLPAGAKVNDGVLEYREKSNAT